MLRVRYDSKDLNRILNNAVSYSYGFLEGVDMQQIVFNQYLAEYTLDALNKYIDVQARMSPEALHHVYEWNQVGSENGRLFKIKAAASKRVITFTGDFLPSKSVNNEGGEPFVNKAEIMENAISITISPKSSDVLVFEDEGELIFTTNSIYIDHPGGDEVAGSFGRVVDEFFLVYFTNAFLTPLIAKLSYPEEFSKMFPQGARGGARPTGISAGKSYLSVQSLGGMQ